MRQHLWTALFSLSLLGCDGGEPETDPADAIDASWAGGKADGSAPEEGSAVALGILRVVNELDYDTLDISANDGGVGLDRRAAAGIVEAREDAPIGSLAQLDAIPYVGPVALSRLQTYASDNGFVEPTVEHRTASVSGRRRGCNYSASAGTYCWDWVDLEAHFDVEIEHGDQTRVRGRCWYTMDHRPEDILGETEFDRALDEADEARITVLSFSSPAQRGDWSCSITRDAQGSWTAEYEFNTSYGPDRYYRSRSEGHARGPLRFAP